MPATTTESHTLRSGFTTGTCAAAAAKAAALCLRGEACHAVEVTLPGGDAVMLEVAAIERLSATAARTAVVKDAGDDPDVTDGMTVAVELELGGDAVVFRAGDGVGTVTLPGLQLPPGEPAINPVPRQMIAAAIRDVLGDAGCTVTVSIPGGAETAAKTFNPRLGITGGLSILGTTGRVEPKSEEAWLRSLVPQIDVALAAGQRILYLAPGGFGEAAARDHFGAPPEAIVQTSNFIGDMLLMCAERGVESVVLIGHAGKLIKVAAGIFNTHSRFGDARLETVAALAAAEGAPAPLVVQLLALPTCEAAIPVLADAGLARVWDAVAERAAQRATQHAGLPVTCAVVGYDRAILGRSAALCTAETGSSLHVVGVGPGTAEWLTPAAWVVMRGANVVVGGRRHLEQYAPSTAERIPIGADIATVMDAIRARREQRIVVLASGDPGCYGILATIRRELPEMTPTVIPGISSMQLALARLGEAWEGVIFASAHGRAIEEVVRTVAAHPRVLALTDHQHPAQALAQALLDAGLDRDMVVLERLGYADERITSGSVDEIAAGSFGALAVVWIAKENV